MNKYFTTQKFSSKLLAFIIIFLIPLLNIPVELHVLQKADTVLV